MTTGLTLTELLGVGTRQLQTRVESPAAEARLLLAHCLEQNTAWLLSHDEYRVDTTITSRYLALVERRAQGEPTAYLLGQRDFWSLALQVTPAVLIPRPETELLVELAIARMPAEQILTVTDLGTGSGAIALAVAQERPQARIHATDYSEAALAVAQDNAQRLGLNHIAFHHGDWYGALPSGLRCDLLLSNPPYIAAMDAHLAALQHEPSSALTAGIDGMDALKQLVAGANNHLKSGGWLLLEHGYDQATAVQSLLQNQGFVEINTWHDLGNQPRVTGGCLP